MVRKIFALCMAGKGPFQIAKQLTEERILNPTAYFSAAGRDARNPQPADPYRWAESTVARILANRRYTGCLINGQSTMLSYKVHKKVFLPEEEWQILPGRQEAIIHEDTWNRVQELRKSRRRNTTTGKTSMFSGLVYCADCGSKLYFAAAKSLKPNQESFRCSRYKENTGECSMHYIRSVVLEQLVLSAVTQLAQFAQHFEPVFLRMVSLADEKDRQQEAVKLKSRITAANKRITDLDRLVERIYEDNVLGRLTDERFARMSANYDAEQSNLTAEVKESEARLAGMEKRNTDLRVFLKEIRKCTELTELTPTIVNTLIRRIDVHKSETVDGHKRVRVDVTFTAVGMADIPAAEEAKRIMAGMEEEQKKTA